MESTLLAGGKSKKDGNLGDSARDSARGQADPGSAAVYTTWTGLVPGPTGVRPKFCLIRYIKFFKIIFRVLLRANGLVLPVVMTRCALRSTNTAYLPRADRGRVNCIHEIFCPESPVRNRGRIPSIQIFDLRRSESTATYCVPLPY